MTERTAPVPTAPASFVVGVAALFAAAAACLMLSLDHLGAFDLPGCGPGSACAAAAASVWGRVPLVNWPLAYLGFAWFDAMLVVWILSGGPMSLVGRVAVRMSALVSCMLLIVIVVEQHFCWYCIAAHFANLVFWTCSEIASRAGASRQVRPVANQNRGREEAVRRPEGRGVPALLAGAALFVVTTLVLVGVDRSVQARAAERAEGQLAASTAEMVRRSAQTQPVAAHGTAVTAGSSEATTMRPLVGRYRWGPEVAPIRIVAFLDYQCRDCKRIELEFRDLVHRRTDLSLSIKHFPMDSECNPHVPTRMHPNACWCARIAEAAGLLYGDQGFRAIHDWMVDRQGTFYAADVAQAVRDFGFVPEDYARALASDEVRERIVADINEAMALGLFFTPMIFINGVELKGWNAPLAVTRAVEAVAATNPPAAGPERDIPPPAGEKYVADWRDAPARPMPAAPARRLGSDAPDSWDVALFGDYLDRNTADADAEIRGLLRRYPSARYSFRHFPVDQTCNGDVARTLNPFSCRAAHLAEAALFLGGADAYWRVHDWLLGHQEAFVEGKGGEAALSEAARNGWQDPKELLGSVDEPDVRRGVHSDVVLARQLGVKIVPTVVVRGKIVPRWKRPGDTVLDRIFAEADARPD